MLVSFPPNSRYDMALADLIIPGRIIAEMRSHDRIEALGELLDRLVDSGSLIADSRETALELLTLREEQRSTSIGNGVAIPHCFLPGLEEVVSVFGRSGSGIDFHAVDHVPVQFVLLFMVPEAQHALHLQTLASIARVLNHAEVRQRLADAPDESSILDALCPSGVGA